MLLSDLSQAMNQLVEQKGWYLPNSSRPQTPRNIAISLNLEASEVLELYQWGNRDPDKEKLQGELADVALYLLQLARLEGIDLEEAILAKLAENFERKWDASA